MVAHSKQNIWSSDNDKKKQQKKKKQPKIVKEVTVHVCVHFLSFYSVTANQTGKQ